MSGAGIDLWWFRLGEEAEPVDDALGFLDEAERARFRGFGSPAAAAFFAFRRAVRRIVLASYLSIPPESLRFREGSAGKPVLEHPRTELAFSASHSGRTGVVVAAQGMPVGVDLELSRSVRATGLAERILSPAEQGVWQATTPNDAAGLVLRAWTAKEAVVKGMGTGLDLAAFREITVAPGAAPGAWQAVGLGGKLSGESPWRVWAATLPGGGFVAVAALSPRPVEVIDAAGLLARHGLL